MTLRKNILLHTILFAGVSMGILLITDVAFAQQASNTSESGGIFYQIWKAVAYPFEYLSGELAKLFIGMAVWFLGIAGSLFDLLIKYTILDFGSTLKDTGIMANIENVWGAFRDIGNIVIIGMFVFVAISIILNLQTYGEKKMIARLLIVAILINFSLFFTKIIIDTSHIAAKQFYTAISTTGGQSASANASQTLRISDAFMARTGISSTFDTGKFIERIRANNGEPFVTIIAYTALSSMLIIAVAIIFLYGSFLLASRGVLLIILMITSSLAFASYLIPSLDGNKYGWKAWKNALLKVSFMAPLLLLFIWASLFILQPKSGGGENTIGAFLNNPTSSNSWEAVWFLFLSIGLLVVSIKMSQSLSNGITGFKIAARVPGLGFLAATRLAAYGGRNVLGGGANRLSDGIRKLNDSLGRRGKETGIERAFMRRLDNLQNFSYDPLNTKRGSSFLKDSTGIEAKKDVGKGGYIGNLDRRAERGIKQAQAVGLTAEEKEKTKQAAIDASKAASAEYAHAEKNKNDNSQVLEQALQERGQLEQQHAQDLERLTNDYVNAQNEQQRQVAADDLEDFKRNIGYEAVENRIKTAQATISNADKVMKRVENQAEEAATKAQGERELDATKRTTHRRIGTLWGAVGTPETDPAAKRVAGVIKKQKGQSSLKDALKEFADSGTPPPPPTQQNTGGSTNAGGNP